ncbi:MAG: hypothetical protein IPK68_20010 [Bdellovibrionales bacterium]|nr:hypothetical protein [Bdellovibrionales bacterium]
MIIRIPAFLFLSLALFAAEARIPQNLRIVPGSELVVNQTIEAAHDLAEIHRISFQAALLVYFVGGLQRMGSDRALATGKESIEKLIVGLESMRGNQGGEDAQDLEKYSVEHEIYYDEARVAFLVDGIPGNAQSGDSFAALVRQFIADAKSLIEQQDKEKLQD